MMSVIVLVRVHVPRVSFAKLAKTKVAWRNVSVIPCYINLIKIIVDVRDPVPRT